MDISMYTHQEEALGKLSNGKILYGGVGSGKSRVGLAYFVMKECGGSFAINGEGETRPIVHPKSLYIITTAKKRDLREWEAECAPFALTDDPEASNGGVAVTIDSWNNIKKYTDVKDAFFIFDEQRLVGSGAWVKAFYRIARGNHWLMLTGTPADTWSDYIPVFVANGFFRNKTEFNQKHVVFKPYMNFPSIDRYVNTGRLTRLARRILVEMPFERHTTRHNKLHRVEYDSEKYRTATKTRINPYTEKPIKHISEMFSVWRRVTNEHPSRIEVILEVCSAADRAIIFYNFDYELEILRAFCEDLGRPYSEWNGHKHQGIPDGNEWIYLVQYTAGAEGWNCTSTDTVIFYSQNYSWRMMEQAKGRVDRANTGYKDLYFHTLVSSSPIDLGIRKALSNKKNFNERSFVG